MQNTIKIKVDGKIIEVDGRITNMSDAIKEASVFATEGTDIPVNDISEATFRKIVEFCERNNYKPLDVPKVNSDQLNKVLDAENLKFVEENSSFDNLELFKAAVNLRVSSLVKAISASFATKIFFKKNDVKDYQGKRDEKKIKEITHEDSRTIADEFPLLNK